jgi:hypothetical protein
MAPPLSIETTPGRCTLFTPDLPLGFATEATDGGPQTAVHVPPGVDLTRDRVNVVLWLHGHKDAKISTIERYLKDARFPLREIMQRHAAPGAPSAVLVAPTLGPRDESGTLATDAAGYLDRVRRAMVTSLSFPASLSWSELVIACHSGGGKPTREIAEPVAAMLSKQGGELAEIWHFDSIYENEAQTVEDPEPTAAWWATWAGAHPGTRIKVFHLTTTAHSEYLQREAAARGLTNVTVVPSADRVHDTVARTYFPGCYDDWIAAMTAAARP